MSHLGRLSHLEGGAGEHIMLVREAGATIMAERGEKCMLIGRCADKDKETLHMEYVNREG